MKATTREQFVDAWMRVAKDITLLGNSADLPETWLEIKDVRGRLIALIDKVATERFGPLPDEDDPEEAG